jgi:hypothetical protein
MNDSQEEKMKIEGQENDFQKDTKINFFEKKNQKCI